MDILISEKLHRNKVRGNNLDFSATEITSKKVRGNDMDFSTIEITSKTVPGNNVDFSTSEIKSKKVRRNNTDFSTSEITSKKVLGNLRRNSSKFGLQCIDAISTSNQRGFDVVCPLGNTYE